MKASLLLRFTVLFGCMGYAIIGYGMKGLPLEDQNTPIEIKSDLATFEHARQEATYEGHVEMIQGKNILHADKLVIKTEQDSQTQCFEAIGLPATYSGYLANDPEPFTATAQSIFYYPNKRLLIFKDDATLTYKQDKFKGPSLRYDLEKQTVHATSNGHARPTITIQPRRQS